MDPGASVTSAVGGGINGLIVQQALDLQGKLPGWEIGIISN